MNRFSAEHSMTVVVGTPVIHKQPVKTSGAEIVTSELLQAQAQLVADCLVPIQYQAVHGTCMDERGRLRLLNGQPTEVRPSAPGGPNIYALGVAELIGLFDNRIDLSAEERLSDIGERLRSGNIKGGGHDDCKASAAFQAWMAIIADQGDELKESVKKELGERYSGTAASFVVSQARDVVKAGRYSSWQEYLLPQTLGDDAGQAMEVTDSVPHEGQTFVRNKVDQSTIDQTRLYHKSVFGQGSFDVDDAYLDDIEHILTSGPDAAMKKLQAEHAREFIVAALMVALPNRELYQIDVVAP
jgi:hypothetical protein